MQNNNPHLVPCNPVEILKKKNDAKLNMSMASPSLIHTESLATEYIRNFILSKLPKDYFKTVYINEKHILDEYRKLDKSYNFLSKPSPALAITPRINYDFNNNNHNDNRFGADTVIRMGRLDTSFVKDYENNRFLALGLKLIELNYAIKIKVDSKSKQVDLFEKLGVVLPIGTKRRFNIDLDFHIPLYLMIQFAHDMGYNLNNINDCIKFVSYLNSKSELPILYKFRRTNGMNEFFVRMRNFTIDLDFTERMSLDDGNRTNQVYDDFMIDFNIGVKMPAPRWYAYYSNTVHNDIHTLSQNNQESVIIGEITTMQIPTVNEVGWNNYLNVDYVEFEKDTIPEIDFTELFDAIHLTELIKRSVKMNISPRTFIDLKTYNSDEEFDVDMDWNTCIGKYNKPFKGITTYIALYLDTEYIHSQNIILEELDKNRIVDKR